MNYSVCPPSPLPFRWRCFGEILPYIPGHFALVSLAIMQFSFLCLCIHQVPDTLSGRRRAYLSHKRRLTLLLTLHWIWLVIWITNDGFLHTTLGLLYDSRKAEMSLVDAWLIAVRFYREKSKCSFTQLIMLKCCEKYRIMRWLLPSCKGSFVWNLGTHLDWRIYRRHNLSLSPSWPASSSIPVFILALLKTFLLFFQLPLILRLWDRYKPNLPEMPSTFSLTTSLAAFIHFLTDNDFFILPANQMQSFVKMVLFTWICENCITATTVYEFSKDLSMPRTAMLLNEWDLNTLNV